MGENVRSGRPKTVSNANCIIKIIKLFKKRKNLLFSGIVIADITWVHYFQPQSNIQFDNNKIWITKDRKRVQLLPNAVRAQKNSLCYFL